MNIVVLDGHTLNPGDLNWAALEELGNVIVYDRTASEQVLERAHDAEILLTNKTRLSSDMLMQLPRLRYVGVLATGYNVVDTQAAAKMGITVTNIPDYGTLSVAQFVFALILHLCHRVEIHADDVRKGGWSNSPDFSYTLAPQIELSGKTLGIIGLGRIGRQTARIALAFGMRVLAIGSGRKPLVREGGIEEASLEQLLTQSDFVSLHCPLTPETNELINVERIQLMKPSAFLINTSRGPLIQEQALADALWQGRLAGAALDVLSIEPPEPDNPLLSAPNCHITPHIAWATREARSKLLNMAVSNVRAFLDGKPINTVAPS